MDFDELDALEAALIMIIMIIIIIIIMIIVRRRKNKNCNNKEITNNIDNSNINNDNKTDNSKTDDNNDNDSNSKSNNSNRNDSDALQAALDSGIGPEAADAAEALFFTIQRSPAAEGGVGRQGGRQSRASALPSATVHLISPIRRSHSSKATCITHDFVQQWRLT